MHDNTGKQKGFGIIEALIVVAFVLIAVVLFFELAGPKKTARDIEWRRSVLFALERAEMNYENDLQAHLDAVAYLEADRLREAGEEQPEEEEPAEAGGTSPADSSVSEPEEPEPVDAGPEIREIADLKAYLRDVDGIVNNQAGYDFSVELTMLGCIVTCLKDGVEMDRISEGKPSWKVAESSVEAEAETMEETPEHPGEPETPDSTSAADAADSGTEEPETPDSTSAADAADSGTEEPGPEKPEAG